MDLVDTRTGKPREMAAADGATTGPYNSRQEAPIPAQLLDIDY